MPEQIQTAQNRSRRRCQNCDSFVSRQFSRVFGDNNDVVHYCPQCDTFSNLFDGHGSGPRP